MNIIEHVCSTCSGTGEVELFTEIDGAQVSEGMTTCHVCHGHKKLHYVPCGMCNGGTETPTGGCNNCQAGRVYLTPAQVAAFRRDQR